MALKVLFSSGQSEVGTFLLSVPIKACISMHTRQDDNKALFTDIDCSSRHLDYNRLDTRGNSPFRPEEALPESNVELVPHEARSSKNIQLIQIWLCSF